MPNAKQERQMSMETKDHHEPDDFARPVSELPEPIPAYDYARQAWVDGPEANGLAAAQLRQEIAILAGPDGEEYAAQFCPWSRLGS